MQTYDVVINGAGMVGAVAALLFAKQGRSVCLIETLGPTRLSDQDDHQLRVSAISKHNLKLFDELGLSRHWQAERIGYYHHMKVWDNHSTGAIHFGGGGNHVMGAMMENDQIVAAAQQQLATHPQVTIHYNTATEFFDVTERKVQVRLSGQEPIQCHLLIGADGARSKVRTELGINTRQKPYQQQGLVCYLKIERAPEHTALQAFNAGGPVGLLPMNGGLFSMVWSLPEDQVEAWLQADENRFINGLKAHINRDFGEISLCSERLAFPLQKTYADAFYQGRVALIGDAAHTIHPLAGQGVNLGFADAECLVEKMKAVSLKKHDELTAALKKFQRVRMAEVHKTSETMHALHHIFTNQSAAIKKLRAWGMNRLDQIKPIKSWLLKQAGS